jgi:hypothetical protein
MDIAAYLNSLLKIRVLLNKKKYLITYLGYSRYVNKKNFADS